MHPRKKSNVSPARPAVRSHGRGSEAKRDALLTAAGQAFRAVGFDRASMSAIATRFGGSKGTLYTYFPSKTAMFEQWFTRELNSLPAAPYAVLAVDDTADTLEALAKFGDAYVKYALSPALLELTRIAVAHAPSGTKIANDLKGEVNAFQRHVCDYLTARLRLADPTVGEWMEVALQFHALLTAETLDRLLRSPIPAISDGEAQAISRAAATVAAQSVGDALAFIRRSDRGG
jgi:AcrR family transcriptional regulator